MAQRSGLYYAALNPTGRSIHAKERELAKGVCYCCKTALLDGCPDDGPALVVDRDNVVHMVWPTVIGGADPEGALFYTSTKDGRAFTPRQRIPTLGSPKPSHPHIAIGGNGSLIVAWDEVRDGSRTVAFRSLTATPQGAVAFGPIQTPGSGVTTYPVLASTTKGVLAAWTVGAGDRAAVIVGRLR
jgi:hypothetical protein